MRLSVQELKVIKTEIHDRDPNAEVFLYGSRVQNHLKGGDIDILVLSDLLNLADKLTILTQIQFQIGEQRIDLTIKSRLQAKSDPFIQSILTTAQSI